jgi:death-on-curing protein
MRHLAYEQLIALHVALVHGKMQDKYYGVLDEGLLRSALARPQNAAEYEGADGIRQAAYLFQGLLMNHGFVQGNKRTAYLALEWFREKNHLGTMAASDESIIEMCYAAEKDKWGINQIDDWLRRHVTT